MFTDILINSKLFQAAKPRASQAMHVCITSPWFCQDKLHKTVEICHGQIIALTRETIERGAPLLTIETEANGDSWKTYERGSSFVGSLGSSYRNNKLLSCLGCSSQYKILFFLTTHTPLRQKARVMTLHGGPPGWLEESDPAE
jgi:hypothetical protein